MSNCSNFSAFLYHAGTLSDHLSSHVGCGDRGLGRVKVNAGGVRGLDPHRLQVTSSLMWMLSGGRKTYKNDASHMLANNLFYLQNQSPKSHLHKWSKYKMKTERKDLPLWFTSGIALKMLEPGHGGLEPSVVVVGHLVLDEIFPVVNVVVIVTRSTNQRAVQHLGIGSEAVVVVPGARGWFVRTGTWAVVRSLGRIVAKPDHVAAAAVSQHVVDLLLGEFSVDAGLEPKVGRHQGDEGRVGGVAVRAPLSQPCESFRRVGHAATRKPSVQERLDIVLVARLTRLFRQEQLCSSLLVIPGELLRDRVHAKLLVVLLCFGEVLGFFGGSVQPCSAPHQLVVKTTPRVVEGLSIGYGVAVFPSVRVGELVQFFSVLEKRCSVVRICLLEGDGAGSHGGGGLGSQVRPGLGGGDLPRGSGHGHVLRPAPVGVVHVTVSHLDKMTDTSVRSSSSHKLWDERWIYFSGKMYDQKFGT